MANIPMKTLTINNETYEVIDNVARTDIESLKQANEEIKANKLGKNDNATSATKAVQDGNGNVITETYAPIKHTHSEYAISNHSHSEYADLNHIHPATNVISGALPITNGGTGAATASKALENLGGMPTTGGKFTGDVTIGGNLILSDGTNIKTELNNINTEHNIKTYTSFEQLGFTGIRDNDGYLNSNCPTPKQVFDAMPEYSMLVMMTNQDNNNLKNYWTNLPVKRGFIELIKVYYNTSTLTGRSRMTFWDTDKNIGYISSTTASIPDGITWNRMLTTADFVFDEDTATLNITL